MGVDRGTPWHELWTEEEVPVLELGFLYPAGYVRARPAREDERDLRHQLEPWRNPQAEGSIRRLLESFGCVEVACLEGIQPDLDSAADYVVRVDGDAHTYCSFSVYALPQLRALGWRIEVAQDYPYRVLDGEVPWYAAIETADDQADWFSLELGIQVGEEWVNLLPGLLKLLESCSDVQSIRRITQRSRFIALPVGEARYATIPAAKIRRLLEVLHDLYRGGGVAAAAELGPRHGEPRERLSARFPKARSRELLELESILAGEQHPLVWRGDRRVVEAERRLATLLEPPAQPVSAPPGLRATLRPYQLEGLAWLTSLARAGLGGVLADDMGLGKTLQTIAYLVVEHQARRLSRPALIVTPTSLTENWRRELGRFAPRLRTLVLTGPRRHEGMESIPCSDVVVTSYPLVLRDHQHLGRFEYHLIVLDEAQAIKNARSQIHRAVRTLRGRTRLALSGTPLENDLGELWSLFDFLMPGHLGNAEQFQRCFRTPIEAGSGPALDLLRRRLRPLVLRRMKEQVSRELPPKTVLVRPVELGGSQRELYEHIRVAAHAEVRRAIRQKGLAASTVTVLDALLKLRQVCCDPRLVAVEAAREVTVSAKYQALLELVGRQVTEGRKLLIFSQFSRMLGLVAEGLLGHRIRYVMLTGSSTNRQGLVDQFQQGKADVFLISLKAGGTGLNLTAADTVIHYDPWWNPAAQAQATDRAYRIGQNKPVFVYQLIVAGSVEERMLRLQERKRALAESVLGDTAGSARTLGEQEIDDLLAPLDEAAVTGLDA
jgi:superfamily II DNA or RNA helicase